MCVFFFQTNNLILLKMVSTKSKIFFVSFVYIYLYHDTMVIVGALLLFHYIVVLI